MTIVAGGDSFVYGSELADCTNTPSKSTFAALLAQDDYVCAAYPGNSNEAIARQTINACNIHKPSGVIVSWTFPGRYEFRFNYNTGQRLSPWYSINSWTIEQDTNAIEKEFVTKDEIILDIQKQTIERAKQTGVAGFAKTFYEHVGGSEYWEVYSSLKEIMYLQNYLKARNIPYLFTLADNSIFYNYTADNADESIISLINNIDMDNFFFFPAGDGKHETTKPRGFYQWAVENKYKVGTTHPLEEAHYAAYELIRERFNEMVKKSN